MGDDTHTETGRGGDAGGDADRDRRDVIDAAAERVPDTDRNGLSVEAFGADEIDPGAGGEVECAECGGHLAMIGRTDPPESGRRREWSRWYVCPECGSEGTEHWNADGTRQFGGDVAPLRGTPDGPR